MELVYLWVEKYKNIEQQGFNFSGRYRCDYDHEKNELTVDENKDYVHIFPKNINVTAIVGENGSGKSSLVKIILSLIFYIKNQNYNLGKKNFDNKFFLIIEQNGSFNKLTIGEEYDCLPYPKINKIEFFSIHFNYMLDTLYDGVHDDWVKKVYHRNDGYSTPVLLEPYKNANNEEKIDLKIIEYLNNQRILKFYNDLKNDELINSFFNPNKLKITLPSIFDWSLVKTPKEDNSTHFNYHYEIRNMTKLSYKTQKLFSNKITRERMGNILDDIQTLYTNNDFLAQNKLYLALKLVDRNFVQSSQIEKIFTDTKNIKAKDVIDKVTKIIVIDDLENELSQHGKSFENEKIRRCIEFNSNFQDSDFKDKFTNALGKTSEINKLDKDFYRFVPPWLEVEFYENNKSIKSLSSGEKGLFTFIINILYQLSNIIQKDSYQSVNLFLDETDVGFHPEWQKKYFNEILKSIEKIWKKKINIILLTHSPFLLSDIPKQNIIFLKDGKQVYPNIDTFGANIHTLLSHGFFMEDGLMGEFAKSKINEIIDFYNEVEKHTDNETKKAELKIQYEEKKEAFWKIQSIIGEAYLKQVVKNYLVEIEKRLLGKDEAKCAEIARVKVYLESLEND